MHIKSLTEGTTHKLVPSLLTLSGAELRRESANQHSRHSYQREMPHLTELGENLMLQVGPGLSSPSPIGGSLSRPPTPV